ncbi:MAG: branched-chain amino acid ABC transporter substrate-binding protein, partial [Beijerinckiaceae bacterium]
MNRRTLLAGLALSTMLTAPALAQDLKIGMAGPVTGPNAAFGKQLTDGVNQAVADINAKGGILGRKLVVVTGDDASVPAQGVSVANKMIADGVRHIVGPFNSGVMLPSSEVYAENGAMMVTPSATNPKITERGLWNVFRTCGRDDQQGAVAADYISKNFQGKKVAIVHDKTPYGQGLATETQKAMNAKGVKEVMFEGVNVGEKDFSALITRLKAAGVDLVYWGGLHTEGGLIVRQMRDQQVRAPMMSGDGITSDEFATIAGPGSEGTLMTFPPDPRKRAEAAAVVAAFRAKNINPESYTLYSYAAVQVMAQAAETIKDLDPKKMAAHVRSGATFKTVIGDLKFDSKGDITRPDYVMYTWKKQGDK